jgi:hypothetical protein
VWKELAAAGELYASAGGRTVAEEDERLGRCGGGQPSAGEELQAARVPHVLLSIQIPDAETISRRGRTEEPTSAM